MAAARPTAPALPGAPSIDAVPDTVRAVGAAVTSQRVKRIIARVSPTATTAAKVAVDAGRSPWFPVGLVIAVGLYLLGQRRLDRGAKLRYAGRPGEGDDELIDL